IGPPDRFMYVIGLTSTSRGPPMPSRPSATSATARRCRLNLALIRSASRLTTMKPALCRVPAYSLPGLPKPTTSHRADSTTPPEATGPCGKTADLGGPVAAGRRERPGPHGYVDEDRD